MLTKGEIYVDTHFQYVQAGVSRLNENRHLMLTREEEPIQSGGECTCVQWFGELVSACEIASSKRRVNHDMAINTRLQYKIGLHS